MNDNIPRLLSDRLKMLSARCMDIVLRSDIVEIAKDVEIMENIYKQVVDDSVYESSPIRRKNCFVFGSNLRGAHGKGAALCALKEHGAIYGQGVGLQGNSYAIPTKDHSIKTLPLHRIKQYVDEFIKFAGSNLDIRFSVTAIGCGLAGYKPEDIAPMFESAPFNCDLPDVFLDVLRDPIPVENGFSSL